MNFLKNQWLLLGFRVFLGGLFVYAALPKMANPFDFAVSIYNYKMLPGAMIGLLAAGLPWLELAAGAMLVLGIRIRAASLAVLGMLSAFTLSMVIAVLRGIDVDCGCFATGRMIGWVSIAQDTALLLPAYACCRWAEPLLALENLFTKKDSV